jgi:hypothetical protein
VICLYDLHLKVYWTSTGKYFHTILIVDFLIINHFIKECSQCHVQYDNLKNFCLNCVPPSKLQPIEIDRPKNKTSPQFIVNSHKVGLVL